MIVFARCYVCMRVVVGNGVDLVYSCLLLLVFFLLAESYYYVYIYIYIYILLLGPVDHVPPFSPAPLLACPPPLIQVKLRGCQRGPFVVVTFSFVSRLRTLMTSL